MLIPFKLESQFREYVWGGYRLRPDVGKTAEAWIVYEGNQIADGPFAGATLAEIAAQHTTELLGSKVVAQSGTRFPLLIKLLDCADWLSLQVHPNDAQAVQLEGPGHLGKTEAWYAVEADEGAQLLGGFQSGVTGDEITASLQAGQILDLVQRHDVQTGDAIFIPAGLLHALGPGLLIYEVQQTSDITYRVYDWDRPMTAGRKLHLAQAEVALNPDLKGNLITGNTFAGQPNAKLVSCDYFELEMLSGQTGPFKVETQGDSFSAITVLDGEATISGNDWHFTLGRFESLLIPAVCEQFEITLSEKGRTLRAFVP